MLETKATNVDKKFVSGIREHDFIDVEKIFGVVRRQWLMVLASIFIGIVASAFYIFMATPQYTATTELMIDSKKSALSGVESFGSLANLMIDSAAIDSQVEVLTSEKIASSVIERMNLIAPPQGDSLIKEWLEPIRPYLKLSYWTGADVSMTEAEIALQKRYDLMKFLSDNLSIKRVGRTYVLSIDFSSADAQQAADISLAFAQAYLDDQLNANFESARREGDWMLLRIQELRQKSINADLKVQQYRKDHNLLQTNPNGVLLNQQQLADINDQLTRSRNATREAIAKYSRLKSIVDSGQYDASVVEAIDNPVVVTLRQKYLASAKTLAELSAKLSPTHIQVLRLRDELKEYQRQMLGELQRLLEAYKSGLDIATAHEKALESALAGQVNVSTSENESLVTLRELERESDAYKNLYQSMLGKYQESVQRQSFPVSEARVITTAMKPIQPSYPRKPLVLALGAMVGGVLGSMLALRRELLNRGFRNSADVRESLGVEPLGMLPMISRGELNRVPMEQPEGPRTICSPALMRYSFNAPFSAFSETLRGTKVAIDFDLRPKSPKVVGVISVLPNEGKTFVAKNFASLLAHLGNRTLLIDGDLRHTSLSRDVAGQAKAGLQNVLTEGLPLSEAILIEQQTNLAVLPAINGLGSGYTGEVLASTAMKKLLEEAGEAFDYIIIDLPPLGPVIDARASEPNIDAFIFVVEWGKTSRDVVVATLEHHPAVYQKCIGLILNKVEKRSLNVYKSHNSKDFYFDRYGAYYTK